MNKTLESFAQNARRQLMEQVAARLEQVLQVDSVEIREQAPAVLALQKEIEAASQQAVIERVAYTWFNRFVALRFMDANGYTDVGVVSPRAGQTQPEILAEAKQGIIDPALSLVEADRKRIFDLLAGRLPSSDAQGEAYRLLLVAECNRWHKAMPFLFEPINDYTELLLPRDLLSVHSVLHGLREALTPETCQDVEVIGWLYQYYISEKKDQVIGSKQKIKPEDIPAATQLFTPHWIVRYLVENSLGRLWLQSHPESQIRHRMGYLVNSEEWGVDSNEQTVGSGEWEVDSNDPRPTTHYPYPSTHSPLSTTHLRLLDPACGSGHMLTYAFDLLYAIYEEQGYDPVTIPRLILEHNLYGLEIDERAGALAAFALTMKAREKDRRFFRRGVRPHITVLEDVTFSQEELAAYRAALGQPDLFTQPLWETLAQFQQAGTFGALIRPILKDPGEVRRRLAEKGVGMDLFLHSTHEKVLRVLEMAEALAPRYHVVVANPPYMGSKNMPPALKEFARKHYPDSKSDLFAMFMERNLELVRPGGLVAMITMQSWMFLSSSEKLRAKLLDNETILNMAHLGPRAFDTISGEVVSTTAFVLAHVRNPQAQGTYLRLVDGQSEAGKEAMFRANLPTIHCPLPTLAYRASAADFKKIPGAPIAYWVSERVREVFEEFPSAGKTIALKAGMSTGDNLQFQRIWHEVEYSNINFIAKTAADTYPEIPKWYPCHSGGNFRKWFGNHEIVVNWAKNGKAIRDFGKKEGRIRSAIRNEQYYFQEGITWTKISSGRFASRWRPEGFVFDDTGRCGFSDSNSRDIRVALGLFCSRVAVEFLTVLAPTMSFTSGEISRIPFISDYSAQLLHITDYCIELAKQDWDAYETSWDFTTLPLLRAEHRGPTLAATYARLRRHWQAMTREMQRLEEENNRLFIEAYGLQEELTPEVPLAEITLTCNPYYRYSSAKRVDSGEWGVDSERWGEVRRVMQEIAAENAQAEGDEVERALALEVRLLQDTIQELISYAVGCLFGRYSLDKPGLVLANQGEGVADYVRKTVESGKWTVGSDDPLPTTHHPLPSTHYPLPTAHSLLDEDNVLPVIGGGWFPDDIVERFKAFLKAAFGPDHYEENLAFVEAALGKDVESYFLRDFYKDHVQRYKKRPIYWLFSSPKGGFQALIYMHRYRPDTVSVVLNDYLRPYRRKLEAHRQTLERQAATADSARERTQALKEMGKLDKVLVELKDYEDQVLYPLATQQIAIDLDDGVKVNYAKFGRALKKI